MYYLSNKIINSIIIMKYLTKVQIEKTILSDFCSFYIMLWSSVFLIRYTNTVIIGQSPDARMINVLLSKLNITADYEQIASPEIINEYKVVIAVVGGSSKGLGAAGIDKDQELERTKNLLKIIKEESINLLVMHIGGEARRGALSDAFLDAVVPLADHLIIVESGNPDGYFNKMSNEYKIPLQSVQKIADTGELVKEYIEEVLK